MVQTKASISVFLPVPEECRVGNMDELGVSSSPNCVHNGSQKWRLSEH